MSSSNLLFSIKNQETDATCDETVYNYIKFRNVLVYVFMYADHISHKIRHHTLPINLVVSSQEALTSG